MSVVAAPELSRVFKDRIASLRLMALLHDLTHAAFGHTLEDEVRVFPEKHDKPSRQVRFFDGLVAPLNYIWRFDGGLTDVNPTTLKGLARLEFDRDEVLAWVEEILAMYLRTTATNSSRIWLRSNTLFGYCSTSTLLMSRLVNYRLNRRSYSVRLWRRSEVLAEALA